jgi:hypothetical protein
MAAVAGCASRSDGSAGERVAEGAPMADGNEDQQRLRCARCGDVIGVYEPLVLVEAHGSRPTSYAAEPELIRAAGELFHRNCHTQARVEQNECSTGA